MSDYFAPGPEVLDDEYPDYNDANSRMISGPVGSARFPGRSFPSWGAAQDWVAATFTAKGVKVYKFWTTPGRWYARVAKPTT